MAFILSFFTKNGIPALGLIPGIKIRDIVDGALLASASMIEVGDGGYRYDFTQYDVTASYSILTDGGPTLLDGERYQFSGNDSFAEDIWQQPSGSQDVSGTMGFLLNNPTLVSGTIDDIIDAIWDEPNGDHLLPGSTGLNLFSGTLPGTASVDVTAIADAVWDETISAHLISGSTGYVLNKLDALSASVELVTNIETGRWLITGTQHIFFDRKNNTKQVANFTLRDEFGSPTTNIPFERIPSGTT
jgi:hypothetical protein